jgi:hypothetical protein
MTNVGILGWHKHENVGFCAVIEFEKSPRFSGNGCI